MAYNDKVRYKHAWVDVSSSGNNEVIAAIANMKIKVLGVVVVSASANTIYFKSATTQISGSKALAANGGFTLPVSPDAPWMETAVGEALNIQLSAAAQVGVTIVYEVNNV